jgi:DNA-binding MarR family transcriptional regulator
MKDLVNKFDLNSYIPCRLAALTHSIMRSVATVFEDRFGISTPEWKVLAIIADAPSLSAVAVAQLAHMDTVAVSRAVTKLVDRGLLLRDLDTEDRRRSVLNLSVEGRELHDQLAPLAAELEAGLLEDLTDDEKQQFEQVIKLLYAKSKVFTDAYTAPPRRMYSNSLVANGQATARHQYRPQAISGQFGVSDTKIRTRTSWQ